jgi:uncharacterized membrane protein (GlpM family)
VRFAFGAVVSAIAGVVSATAGPRAGGIFLAFPAILLASLTLVAKEEGLRTAREDAQGAALGAIGMIAFAALCWALADRLSGPLVLALATAGWLLVSLAAYGLVRLGAGRHTNTRGTTP